MKHLFRPKNQSLLTSLIITFIFAPLIGCNKGSTQNSAVDPQVTVQKEVPQQTPSEESPGSPKCVPYSVVGSPEVDQLFSDLLKSIPLNSTAIPDVLAEVLKNIPTGQGAPLDINAILTEILKAFPLPAGGGSSLNLPVPTGGGSVPNLPIPTGGGVPSLPGGIPVDLNAILKQITDTIGGVLGKISGTGGGSNGGSSGGCKSPLNEVQAFSDVHGTLSPTMSDQIKIANLRDLREKLDSCLEEANALDTQGRPLKKLLLSQKNQVIQCLIQ